LRARKAMKASKSPRMIPVMTHVTPWMLEQVDRLVQKRLFSCRAEFIRYAIMVTLRQYLDEEQSIELASMA